MTAACPWPVCLLVTFPFEKTPVLRLGKTCSPPHTPRNASRLASLGTLPGQSGTIGLQAPSYKAEEVSALLWSPC